MVDYDNYNDEVSNFRCVLGDWGTSGFYHMGGTPMYAGPRTFTRKYKDLFSIGRLALEMFLEPKGKVNFTLKFLSTLWIRLTLVTEWLYLSFYPQEDSEKLLLLRASLTQFHKSVRKALAFELEYGFWYEDSQQRLIEHMTEAILTEILQNVPPEVSGSNLNPVSAEASNTLQLELERLEMNKKYVLSNDPKMTPYYSAHFSMLTFSNKQLTC